MSSRTVFLALVASASVAAAGVGGYWAVRIGDGDRAAGATLGAPAPAPLKDASAAPPAHISAPAPVMPSRTIATKTPKGESTPATDTPSTRPDDTDAATKTPPPATPVVAPDPPVTDPVVPVAAVPDPPTPVDPPKPKFEELTVAGDSVIGLRLESAISTETAKVEDKISARVARDVTVNGRTAIPAGARLEGQVTAVDRGGKFKNKAHLVIRFDSLILADNTRMAIQTEAIARDAEGPGNEAAAKVGGGAVVGAILGGLIGGKKGVAIGAGAGAGAGTAAVAAGKPSEVVLPAGSPLTVRLTSPVTLLIGREGS